MFEDTNPRGSARCASTLSAHCFEGRRRASCAEGVNGELAGQSFHHTAASGVLPGAAHTSTATPRSSRPGRCTVTIMTVISPNTNPVPRGADTDAEDDLSTIEVTAFVSTLQFPSPIQLFHGLGIAIPLSEQISLR
jgi:hypothetical protein